MSAKVVDITDREPRSPSFAARLYLPEIFKGMLVTIGHFLRNIVAIGKLPTILYPEQKRNYSERFRGKHILKTREDGTLKCVACYMCAQACPADCIQIVAGEHPKIAYEKYPVVFNIDMLRCVMCGFCVDACPEGRDLDEPRLRALVFHAARIGLRHLPARRKAGRPRQRRVRIPAVLPRRRHRAPDRRFDRPRRSRRRRTKGAPREGAAAGPLLTRRRQIFLFLALWWLALGAVNLAWLSKNTRPPSWDPFNHLFSGAKYHNLVADLLEGNATVRATARSLLRVDDHYPPLAPLAAGPAFGGADPRSPTLFLNQAALALLIGATYAMGKRYSSEATGILAAIAVSSFPIVSMQSRMFMLDLPDAAMTALALLALCRADAFRRAAPSLVFGATLGLALLTKWTVVFFLAAPLAFELLRAARSSERGRRLGNAGAGLLLAAAIPLPWYSAHLWNILRDSAKFSYDVGVREGDPPVFTAKSLFFYASSLPAAVLAPWAFLFVGGLALAARDRFRRGRLMFFAILGGWAILTLIRNKDSRYVIPMLPVIAVVAASALDAFRVRFRWKAAAAGLLAAISLGAAWRTDPPVRENWPIHEAVEFLRRQPVSRPRLRVVPDWPYFERHGFEYAAEEARFPLDVGMWFHFPAFTDFVITKSGDQGERPEPKEIMREVEDPRSDFRSLFQPVWEHPLPDGGVARIYARHVAPAPAEPDEIVRRLRSAAADLVAAYFRDVEGLEIDVDPYSDGETRSGRFRRIDIRISTAAIRGKKPGSPALALRNVRLEVSDVVVNPYRLLRDGTIEVLSLREAAPSVELREEDASEYLASLLRGPSHVRFSSGTISIEAHPRGRIPAISLSLEPRIVAGENIGFHVTRFRVGDLPIPAAIAGMLTAGNDPILKPMPCRVRLDRLSIEGGVLALNE